MTNFSSFFPNFEFISFYKYFKLIHGVFQVLPFLPHFLLKILHFLAFFLSFLKGNIMVLVQMCFLYYLMSYNIHTLCLHVISFTGINIIERKVIYRRMTLLVYKNKHGNHIP